MKEALWTLSCTSHSQLSPNNTNGDCSVAVPRFPGRISNQPPSQNSHHPPAIPLQTLCIVRGSRIILEEYLTVITVM